MNNFEAILYEKADKASKEFKAYAYKEKRDEFAKAALAGILANPALELLETDEVAQDAFKFADAMMKARGE